jgi:hypothetical protein
MSKTTKVVTAVELISAPLPAKTATYTVISHEFIISHVKEELAKAGFKVVKEEYRANNNLEVARGSYIIEKAEDPNFTMSFNWVNSYDKSTKFQCAVGGYIWENNAYVIDKEDNTFVRKHTGDADSLAKDIIADKIVDADKYYHELLSTKNHFQFVTVNRSEVASILGDLYFTYDMISIEQLSSIKKEYNKPTYVYTSNSDSLWTIYCHILTVIKSSHPKLWLHQQGFIHNYLKMRHPKFMYAALKAYPKLPTDGVGPVEYLPTKEEVKAPEKAETLFNIDEEINPESLQMEQVEEETDILLPYKVVTLEDLAETIESIDVPDEANDTSVSAKAIVMDISDPESMPEPLEDYIERTNDSVQEEVVQEELTFEEEEKPWSESTKLEEGTILSKIQDIVNNVFGYEIKIEVFQNDDKYDITTEDGNEMTIPVDYVKSLL